MGASNLKTGVMSSFNNAIALVTNPVSYMTEHKNSNLPINTVMINYVAVLAAIPFIGTLLGDLWYYGGYAGLVGFAVFHAILVYVFSVASVYVVGIAISKLGPTFGTNADQQRSTMFAAYIFTPFFLISILDIIPFVGWISFLGTLYGLYICYLGIPILFNTAKDKVVGYTIGIAIAALIITGIAFELAFVIAAGIFISTLYRF